MNVLITGGLGHIGSYLIRMLPEEFNITVVDNLLTHRYCSLFDLNRNIKFYDMSVSEFNNLENIDTVIHLAAITDAASSFGNQDEIERINVTETQNFYDRCNNAGIKRFIFPSSTSVYGTAKDIVYEDDDDVLNPQSPYAKSKIDIERYMTDHPGSIDFLVLRFGTIFGDSIGMRFHTAINKFCYQASVGKPLTIWKQNYDQVRPYLGLVDAISSIMHFLNMPDEFWNTQYNVLTGNYSLKTVIQKIEHIIGNVELNMVDTPLLNQYSYHVSNEKIINTGWCSTDNLSMSIERTLVKLRNLV